MIEKVWVDPFSARSAQVTPQQLGRVHDALSSFLWQLPWGDVTTEPTGKNDGTAAAIGTTLTALWSVDCQFVANRKYHIQAEVNYFSPGGAGNFNLYLAIGGVTVENVEGRPSTAFGTTLHLGPYEYKPTSSGLRSVDINGLFTAGGGTILYDQTRNIRLTCVDVGPA